MVTRFAVCNFRAFRDWAYLPLAALTCLVGRNSSGKSSLSHALLLLRQSIEQRAIGSRVTQLNMQGPLIDAGTFEDIVYGHNASESVGFSFEVNLRNLGNEDRPQVAQPPLIRLDLPRPSVRPGVRHVSFELRHMARGFKPNYGPVEICLWFSPQPPFGPTLQQLDIKIRDFGEMSFRRTIGRRRVQHWRTYAKNLPSKGASLLFPAWSFFPMIRPTERNQRKIPEAQRARLNEFLLLTSLAMQEVDRFITDLRFLGPFRTPPARRYTFSGIAAADTGISGERAVDLLITEFLLHPKTRPLSLEVSRWMQKLSLANRVKVRPLAKRSNIFEVSVSGAGPAGKANFADVGFGISQVLPVLVQGYLVPRGGTYIVQQPELHLHPDAQAALADFFLFLASRGVNSIIETHSEYLLVRLRRRLAEKQRAPWVRDSHLRETVIVPLKKGDISVVYVGESERSAHLNRLEIGAGFQFENLPQGFMNQSVDDRLQLLRALKS
jgi:hypothetical protein